MLSAATALGEMDPEHVRMAAPLLGHGDYRTTERHYVLARSGEALRRHHDAIVARRARRRRGGCTEPGGGRVSCPTPIPPVHAGARSGGRGDERIRLARHRPPRGATRPPPRRPRACAPPARTGCTLLQREGQPLRPGRVPAVEAEVGCRRSVLQGLGATPRTPVTILSDGADGPRSLGEAASLGPPRHVLDWLHLAMRIHHAAQAAEGWPADTPGKGGNSARLANAVERIQWRLRHGWVRPALDLIGETLAWLVDKAEAAPVAPAKVAVLLRGLETYVSGQADLIID